MVFSILALLAVCISICIKDRKKSLYVQSLNCFFEAIYDFLISAFTGAILSIINLIRTFIFINKSNRLDIYNGKLLNEDINNIGIKQAQEASKKIKNLNLDLIICSPLLRTRHTCDIINSNKIKVIYDDRIEERNSWRI